MLKYRANANKEGIMSKVAAYLRGHITGEVSTRGDVRSALASDTGVLTVKPELVIYPRTTNDIRKVTRFAWQLAEKGHTLPVTVRGAGTDSTGAAIGKGVVMVMPAHMNRIFEYDARQKLVRLQPGATVSALNSALALHGTAVMSLVGSYPYGTVGGAIASAVSGMYAGKYGTIAQAIDQLEVVLANGDVIQTGRISKKELNRRKGLQGFEGDIYRGVDGVIEEYADVLDQLRENDAVGYSAVADVKQRDGSFDLTPLFVGSQGTLGVISEMIMRADFRSSHVAVAGLVFANANVARDAIDDLARLNPAFLEYFDATLFETASAAGRTYGFYKEASDSFKPASVVIIGFDDFNSRHREKALKKLKKLYANNQEIKLTIADDESTDELIAALDVAHYTSLPDHIDTAGPALFSGFSVSMARLDEFMKSLADFERSEHIKLPLSGHMTTNIFSIHPTLSLHRVADKQKVFKLLDDLTKLVYAHGGTMVAEGGEGRLKTHAVYAQLDERVVEMHQAVRAVFDPLGTLNPGVKQPANVRTLASMLRKDHEGGQLARFGL